MKIWKEAVATALTLAALTLALSVTQAWNWPLLADARAGIIALAVVGLAACITSGSAASSFSMRDPLLIVAIIVGGFLGIVAIAGLVTNAMIYLVLMMGATVVLWFVATLRHLLEASPSSRQAAGA